MVQKLACVFHVADLSICPWVLPGSARSMLSLPRSTVTGSVKSMILAKINPFCRSRLDPKSLCFSKNDLPAPITIKCAGKRNAGGLILLIPIKNHQPLITSPSGFYTSSQLRGLKRVRQRPSNATPPNS